MINNCTIYSSIIMQISSIFFSMLVCSTIQICHARDTITKSTPLNDDNETIISAGNIFELGLFTGSDGSYVGIWYYKSQPKIIVWVASNDQPLSPDSERVVSIGEDGNLKVMDKFLTSISTTSNTTVKLLDTGNLVLIDNQSSKYLWQSFENPTDTFLPGMLMKANMKLTSWGDHGIPETGSYIFKLDQEENLYVITKNDEVYWKSGEPSDKLSTSEMNSVVANLLANSSRKNTPFPKINLLRNSSSKSTPFPKIPYNDTSSLARLVLTSAGVLELYKDISNMTWFEPKDQCSVYNACGDYGICNNTDEGRKKECECLKGFEHVNDEEWQSGDYIHGCKRITKLCNSTSGGDTFFHLPSVKLVKPTILIQGVFDYEVNCSDHCLRDCQCQAFSFVGASPARNGTIDNAKSGCRIWKRELRDIQQIITGGINLQVRVPVSDLNSAGQPNSTTSNETKLANSSHTKQRVLIIVSITAIATIVICILSYLFYIAKNRSARASTRNSGSLQPTVFMTRSHAAYTTEGNIRKSIDVSFFKFQTILVATDNFSEANKLGEGGFGPVYKGVFADEQYLAVKRLSSNSGQGVDEFQNEVALIAKLQHRNLVRIVGYCVEKDERVLIYEYMPNKSLDKFIFNQKLSYLLDWTKRFDIIFGVARGLLYLHQDSRLRIIHRDLKTSNILLDEEMNPKISDFGLARIVQGKQTEVNTNRVVGTYGYMSPEYALEGLFSIKSDVFSFGVIVLEIISGKRNTGFSQSRDALNLLGYAWKVWEAKKQSELLDKALEGRCNETEVCKCVNIGLLCVQEDPGDRPTMADVVTMLSSASMPIPSPCQPAFIERRSLPSTSSSSSTYREAQSFNKLTVTVQEGR